jgi:hypothetical protein
LVRGERMAEFPLMIMEHRPNRIAALLPAGQGPYRERPGHTLRGFSIRSPPELADHWKWGYETLRYMVKINVLVGR